jgi:TRAP-type C4-dicarboxylate transport system permease large subunit
MTLFVIKGITDAPLSDVIRGASPFVVLMIGGLAALIAFPELATWLPYGVVTLSAISLILAIEQQAKSLKYHD